MTVTPTASDGTFFPASVTLGPTLASASFRYAPATAGSKTISTTNTAGLTNPTASFTASTSAATAIWLEGPTTGRAGVASEPFTVGANGVLSTSAPISLSVFIGGGTFTPTTFMISPASPLGTFTFTPTRPERSAFAVGSTTLAQTMYGYAATSTPATALRLSGPDGGLDGVPSGSFVLTADGDIAGTGIVVTPVDAAGGAFSPPSVIISYSVQSPRFTYTPRGAGARSITLTHDGGLANPPPHAYLVSPNPATAVTVQAPPRGPVGSTSPPFIVAVDAVLSAPITVTPSATDGTFDPASVTLTPAAPSATFRYTATTAGMKTISLVNTGGLTNPTVTYDATTGAPTRLWIEGPTSGPVGVAAGPFLVGADGIPTSPLTLSVTTVSGRATFTPMTLTLDATNRTATFTLTPTQAGLVHFTINNPLRLTERGFTAQ